MEETSSTTLLTLNAEVKLLIVENLSQPDLCSLCLVHSQLYSVARRALYSSVDLGWRWKNVDQKWTNPIVPLLRTILWEPLLGKYIKTITCSKGQRRHNTRPDLVTVEMPDTPLEEAVAFVQRTELPDRGIWHERVQRQAIDGYLAILLTQLPGLRTAHLSSDLFVEHEILGQVLRSLLCSTTANHGDGSAFPGALPGSLSRLQTVTIDRARYRYAENPYIPNTEDLLPFFHISSLKAAAFDMDLPVVDALSPTLPPISVNLRQLTLETLRESHLGQLISLTPRLCSFHWRWKYFHGINFLPHNTLVVDIYLILSALNQVKEILTELNIHAIVLDGFFDQHHYSLQVNGSAQGLADFHQLKKLTIPLAFLAGFDPSTVDEFTLIECLPPNLEYLNLLDDLYRNSDPSGFWRDEHLFTRHILTWLKHVIRHADPKPTLKRLCIGFGDESMHFVDQASWEAAEVVREEIQRVGQEAGIEVRLEPWVVFPETGWEDRQGEEN